MFAVYRKCIYIEQVAWNSTLPLGFHATNLPVNQGSRDMHTVQTAKWKDRQSFRLGCVVPIFIIISVLPYLKVGSVYNITCSSQHTPREMWCEFELTVAGTFVKGTKASLLQSCSINVFLVFNWLTLHWINEYIRTQSDWIRCCSKHGSPPSHLNEGCASRHHVAVAKHVRWRSDQQLEWVKTQWSVNYESAFGECQIKGLLIAELNAKGGTQQTFLSSVIT